MHAPVNPFVALLESLSWTPVPHVVVVLAWVACAGLGAYVAAQKGRLIIEGLVLGLLFGPLGLVVEALLPTIWWRCSCGRPRAFGLMKDGDPAPCPKCRGRYIRAT